MSSAVSSSSAISAAPDVRWSVSIYTEKPARLPLLNSNPDSPHCLVFIGGLTDSLGTVPFLNRIAQGIAPYGFSVVQLQLSSALGGFGVCSLEGDAEEIALAVMFLRSKGKDKIILMGHSTGSQDVMEYLSYPGGCAARGQGAKVDGAILQGPVSDREAFEGMEAGDHRKQLEEKLVLATSLVKEGKGSQLLPRDIPIQRRPEAGGSKEQLGNVDAVYDSPMTAYRFWSLYDKGGDDDYFSTDLGEERTRAIWAAVGSGLGEDSKGYVLALVGAEDEHISRPQITPEKIVETWAASYKGTKCRFEVLPSANHRADAAEAQVMLVAKIRELIKALGVPLRAGRAPAPRGPPPALASKGIPAWQLADPSGASTSSTTALDPTATAFEPSPDAAVKEPAQVSTAPASVATASAAVPPHPPSFDALVELIATGRTDEIEGIRDIPLKINEDAPSESKLEQPKKPWQQSTSWQDGSMNQEGAALQ